MTRYNADQNKVLGLYESGTYASVLDAGSTFWIGQVTEHSIDDAENKLENYFLGTSSRSFGIMAQGPNDITGTVTYHPVDFRTVFWAIGSVGETTATNGSHVAVEVDTNVSQNQFVSGTGQLLDAPISFTIEDSKQAPGTGRNFVRTVRGVVPNSVTVTASQGEKVVVEYGYIAQSVGVTSGTTTTVTDSGLTPYLWSACSLTVNGSNIPTAKEVSLEINQNTEGPHYLNGSRVIAAPFMGNRQYTLNVTLDLDSASAVMLYDDLYKDNATFNASFDLNQDSTGSQHTIFTMSGCKITTMENPSTSEGLTESTVEIRPKNVSAVAFDQTTAYNPF